MMQSWSDFSGLEHEHYSAMFADYNREDEAEQEPTAWYVWWESDGEGCEDSERIEAETAEIARMVFLEFVEDGVNDIPRDAVIRDVSLDEY